MGYWMRIPSFSELLYLLAGMAMIFACIYGLFKGYVYAPAKNAFPWGFTLVTSKEGGLFWVVLVLYAFCGSVLSAYGLKDVFPSDRL